MNFPFVMNPIVFPSQKRRNESAVLGDWLNNARKLIANLPDASTASLNALVGFALNKPSHFGYSHPELCINSNEDAKLNSLLDRLMSGEPLAYLIEKQDFYNLEFKISPDVLIPRPETELLVDFILKDMGEPKGSIFIADIGTGSGCIAISIAINLIRTKIFAADISNRALRIAQENINRYNLNQQIKLVQTDLLSSFHFQFDYICANLPYIPSEVLKDLAVAKFEPRSALDGGEDGLFFISRLLEQSRSRIQSKGKILLEIEAHQSHSVMDLASSYFPAASIKIIEDLSGHPRLAIIEQ